MNYLSTKCTFIVIRATARRKGRKQTRKEEEMLNKIRKMMGKLMKELNNFHISFVSLIFIFLCGFFLDITFYNKNNCIKKCAQSISHLATQHNWIEFKTFSMFVVFLFSTFHFNIYILYAAVMTQLEYNFY